MIDAARRLGSLLEATPYATRVGLRTGEIMGDAVTASVPWVPVLANAQGFVHGGVAASLSVWSAMLLAVASDTGGAASARPLSISVSYLAAAREEALHATARLASRGRDVVHAEVEVASERGRPVAAALAVLKTAADVPRQAPPRHGAERFPSGEPRSLISPFSQSMGIDVRTPRSSPVAMAMRFDLNEGLGGAVDPGALVALADTCAALACLPSLDERLSGSATLSLSAVFGDPVAGPVIATGRPVAEEGGLRSALVEIGADADARPARLSAMTACVAYRFVVAERSR